MIIEDRLLFLKYALPCAGTLVRRGNVSKEYIDKLTKMVSEGRVPKEDAESMFKVATAMCNSIAERMNKEAVDADVIRTYFLLEHSEVVDDRFNLMKDFNPVDCKTYSGKVAGIGEGFANVRTRLGEKRYKTDFAKDLHTGDTVIVHWDYVVEKAPEDFLRRMNQ